MAICRPCLALPCTNPDDLAAGIDGALYSSLDFSFIVQCPPGCFCPPGLFPQTISILSSTIPPVIPPINEPGANIVLRLQGCTSLITRTLSAGSSQSQIAGAAQSMQAEWAGQQALCNALLTPGIDCNTGRTINVCNDAQSFLCAGVPTTVAAGTYCSVLSIDGLTQVQIDAATAVLKTTLNNRAKQNICPFFGVLCGAGFSLQDQGNPNLQTFQAFGTNASATDSFDCSRLHYRALPAGPIDPIPFSGIIAPGVGPVGIAGGTFGPNSYPNGVKVWLDPYGEAFPIFNYPLNFDGKILTVSFSFLCGGL